MQQQKKKRQHTQTWVIIDHRYHIPDLQQDILRTNGDLNLVLWLAKSPASIAMFKHIKNDRFKVLLNIF